MVKHVGDDTIELGAECVMGGDVGESPRGEDADVGRLAIGAAGHWMTGSGREVSVATIRNVVAVAVPL